MADTSTPTLSAGQIANQFSAASLPAAEDFASFAATALAPSGLDLRFSHSAAGLLRVDRTKLEWGVNWFGASDSKAADLFRGGTFPLRETETVLLNDAIFSPSSTAVYSVTRGLYDATLRNFLLMPNGLQGLVKNDGLFRLDESGTCYLTSNVALVQSVEAIGIAICGTGFHNYGHFLYDGLPAVLLLVASLRNSNVVIVGPPLARWQSSILQVLGLLEFYLPLSAPTLFRKLVVSSFVSLHVPYPTRFVRPLFDTIRFKLGGSYSSSPRRIWISRQDDVTRRLLVNRAEVEECAKSYGFDIVLPSTLSFEAQVRLFSGCSIVAGESGAGMANVGFCDPGVRVLELQPVAFVEGWTRAACMFFGLEWHVLFAETVETEAEVNQESRPLEFRVDLDILAAALEQITRSS